MQLTPEDLPIPREAPRESEFTPLPPGQHGLDQELVGADQRARLHAAMIQAVAESGFVATTVEDVLRRARVSRRTFYTYYENKADAFVAACDAVLADWARHVTASYEAASKSEMLDARGRLRAGLLTLLGRVLSDPLGARAIFIEMLNSETALLRLSDAIAALELAAAKAFDDTDTARHLPDWLIKVIIGGAIDVVTTRLRQGTAAELLGLAEPMLNWMLSYRSVEAAAMIDAAMTSPAAICRSAAANATPAASGKPAASPLWRDQAARPIQPRDFRARIIDAVIEVVSREGYTALSASKITTEARASHHTFKKHFKDSHEAFMTAYRAGHEQLVEYCLRYIDPQADWPTNVRTGIDAWLRFFTLNPKLARLGFIEVFAAGPTAIAQRDQGLRFFTFALEGGYALAQPPPHQIYSELIAGGIFKLTRDFVLERRPEEIELLTPVMTYAAEAPFIGAEYAARISTAKPSM